VSPTETVTDDGEKKKSWIVTVVTADLCAFWEEAADATAAGAAVGTPPEAAAPLSEGAGGVRRVEPADVPAGGASGVVVVGPGLASSAGVVVVVAAVVAVPWSWAAEIAGAAQAAARTSIPLARALTPFIDLILRRATCLGVYEVLSAPD
jgi:hypothetical protein